MRIKANLIEFLLILSLLIVFLILPSVNSELLMNGTQTGKTVYFLYGILFLFPLGVLYFLLSSYKIFKFSLLDLILFIWFLFIAAKSIIQKESYSLYFAEFSGLALLYVILRFLNLQSLRWLFIAVVGGGAIQAVYGNLQLWGYFPSHHNLFKLTGSFFNPGPFAGYLASVFPVALGSSLFRIKWINPYIEFSNSSSKISQTIQNGLKSPVHWLHQMGLKTGNPGGLLTSVLNSAGYFVAVISMICIMLVLPASQSRAGWLAVLCASVYLFVTKYNNFIRRWLCKNAVRKYITVSLLAVVILSGGTALYFMKKDSADGRLLIWKVTTNMIAEHPFTGTGINSFKAHYMDYQAGYFERNPDSGEAMVAGDTNYAFNELLQQTVQHGLPGGLLLIAIIVVAFSVKQHDKKHSSGESVNKEQEAHLTNENDTVAISKAVLLSVAVFSMFSYPAQILPVKINLVLVLAYLGRFTNLLFMNKDSFVGKASSIKAIVTKTALSCFTALFVFYGIPYLRTTTEALKDWKYAYSLYNMGAYEQSLNAYKKAMPVLHKNGGFLTNYGKALSIAKEYGKAIETLKQAAKYYSNTVVYTALGDSYKATGQFKNAEEAYTHAWYMNPGRFYPKYLLAKLYDETGQVEKAEQVANELLEKKIKVESTAVEEIKAEMQQILIKGGAAVL